MSDLTGTNGNDFFAFQGETIQLTLTFIDPNTGDIFTVDDEFNVNSASYEGLAGIDTLFMTNAGDAIFIENYNTGAQEVSNIEIFFAGNGGDIIHLASDNFTLGDITVDGGGAADIILSNIGDDILNGNGGDDIISGGAGNDILNGNSGNDKLNGGDGSDILNGNSGDDTLVFFTDGATEAGWYAWNVGSPGVNGTSELVSIEGTNMSLDIFDGGAGFDTLQMTDGDDAIFLNDPFSTHHPDAGSIQLIDIEQINAGGGDDVVDLTEFDLEYGDIIINGEGGNDHLWSSSGNDTINGGTGNDHIFGGGGDDELNGDSGDDEIYGSIGNDVLRGGAGNDTLYGGASSSSEYIQITEQNHSFNNTIVFPSLQERVDILDLVPSGENALGIAAGDLSVDFATTAEVSFVSTEAGFNNSLGFYNISLDGTIGSVDLAFPNVKNFSVGDTATINLPGAPDTDFGFFMIANGARKNNDFKKFDLDNGEFKFIYDLGGADERLANIADSEDDIVLVFDDSITQSVVVGSNNHIYHTTIRDGDTNLNPDGEVHTVSGVMEGSGDNTLRIGFEDLPNLGDADYNDVVFDITVQSQTSVVLLAEDNDVLIGGAGDDIMDGGIGDDLLVGGEGADLLYGDQGIDTFLFQSMADAGDTIMDFEWEAGGDVINVTDLLEGFDASLDDVNDFMQLVNNGNGDTELQVNADGQGSDFVTLVTIDGGLGATGLSDLLVDGNLAVDQSILVV